MQDHQNDEKRQAEEILRIKKAIKTAQLDHPVCPKCHRNFYPGTECINPDCIPYCLDLEESEVG